MDTQKTISERIERLSPAKQALLAMRLKQQGVQVDENRLAPQAAELQLVAYVTPNTGQEIAPAGLRNFLAGKLPGYMVPAHFVPLIELPRTPNGKLDRQALPDLQSARSAAGRTPPSRPADEIEAQLTGLWAELLGFEAIEPEDNFFELGGHSLLVTRLVARLRDIYPIDMPVRAFFQTPTIAGLAGQIRSLLLAAELEKRPLGETSGEERDEIEL